MDYRRRLALVAERETVAGVELIGVGRYEPSDGVGDAPSLLDSHSAFEEGLLIDATPNPTWST